MKERDELNKKILDVEYINSNRVEKNKHANRKITVISNMPFYCSSGVNSCGVGTWFPFLGVLDMPFCRQYHAQFAKFQKSHDSLKKYQDDLSKLGIDKVQQRFGNQTFLAMSANMGGGVWNSKAGKRLKERLKKDHPSMFDIQINPLDSNQVSTVPHPTKKDYKTELTKDIQFINEHLKSGGFNEDQGNFLAVSVKEMAKLLNKSYEKQLEQGLEELMNTSVYHGKIIYNPNYQGRKRYEGMSLRHLYAEMIKPKKHTEKRVDFHTPPAKARQ